METVSKTCELVARLGPLLSYPRLDQVSAKEVVSVNWKELVGRIGAPGLHLHDLRHTGNTLAASTGASLRDLMARMGHDSPAAALIYQHATREADTAIALALEAKLRERKGPEPAVTPESGETTGGPA